MRPGRHGTAATRESALRQNPQSAGGRTRDETDAGQDRTQDRFQAKAAWPLFSRAQATHGPSMLKIIALLSAAIPLILFVRTLLGRRPSKFGAKPRSRSTSGSTSSSASSAASSRSPSRG
jgi:hypothetical protein